ncbi:hypothetical protein EKO04_005478 [Ascochyta lentis]|uniref:Complex III subunit 9 n=1 Tax=Ascochyta lentis TaxID=205686 RepID=A0A8H7MHS1_9PLEO|nr:hypothetical protein EKO04_005478 [Ascochyta lentis]
MEVEVVEPESAGANQRCPDRRDLGRFSCRPTSNLAAPPPHPSPQPLELCNHLHNGRLREHRLQASLPLRRHDDRTVLTVDYSTIIRSNVTLLGTVFAAAFGMQLAFDTGSERIWDNLNRGRQWKDIKQRYIEAAEDDE